MRSLMVSLAVALVGCSNVAAPATSPADMGDAGDMVQAGLVLPAAGMLCTPNAKFCGPAEIRTCSADGLSSTQLLGCTGSSTNPGLCDGVRGAHCQSVYAACAWNMNIPWLSQGANMGTPAPSSVDWCTSTSTSSTIAFGFTHGASTVSFSVPSAGLTLGQQYNINQATLTVDGCSNPSGSCVVDGTMPYWDIVIQTTCNSAEFAAQFSGAI